MRHQRPAWYQPQAARRAAWAVLRPLSCLGVALLVCMAASMAALPAASAQQPADSSSPPPLLLLLTEDVLDAQDKRQQSAWWVQPERPKLSASDALLTQQLQRQGIVTRVGQLSAPLSRVYRVPTLSWANAAAVLATQGVALGVVGTLSLRPLGARDAWGQSAYRAEIKVALVSARRAEPLAQITLERTVVEDDPGQALSQARAQSVQALGQWIAHATRQSAGPVGQAQRQERLLVFQAVPDLGTLEAIQRALLAVQGVDRVQVRWASVGHIALEINPEKLDKEDLIDQAARALEGMSLQVGARASRVARAQPGAELGLVELLRLEPEVPSGQ